MAVWIGLPLVASAADRTPTFAKDVAPIFYKHCVECHRPTMFAPMSLMTFESARPWAQAIKRRVANREMPPWTADPTVGKFKNDPRLSQAEIDTMVDGFFASWFRRGTWIQLTCSTCGQSVSFSKPTVRKVDFYMSLHRCEPAV